MNNALINNLKSTMILTAMIALITATANAALAGPPPPEAPEYEVTVIPGPFCGLFGYEPARGWGINDLGNICGDERNCASEWEPFFWSPETGRIVLNAPPSILQGRALDLNNANAVVGWYHNGQPDPGQFGFVWQDGQFTTLPSLPGSVTSVAQAINDSGDIAGFGLDQAQTGLFALLWRDEQIITLQLPIGPSTVANDINQNSQITGWMGNAPFIDSHAFIWDDGNVIDLGVIPGGFSAEGKAINNHGDVAVLGLTFNDNKEVIVRSFLWRDGLWIDIGVLPGFDETLAVDLNDAGEVTGRCKMLDSTAARPFLWRDGTMWDITDLWNSNDKDLVFIGLPTSISQVGQITTTSGLHNVFSGPTMQLSPMLPIPGDLDGDGTVNTTDLLILLGSWGLCDDCNDCPADLDGSCSVSTTDLLILFSNWG